MEARGRTGKEFRLSLSRARSVPLAPFVPAEAIRPARSAARTGRRPLRPYLSLGVPNRLPLRLAILSEAEPSQDEPPQFQQGYDDDCYGAAKQHQNTPRCDVEHQRGHDCMEVQILDSLTRRAVTKPSYGGKGSHGEGL